MQLDPLFQASRITLASVTEIALCVCVFLFVARGALAGLVESSGVYSRLKVYRMFYLSSVEMCLTSREPKEDSRLTEVEIHFYMKGKTFR